MFNNLGLNPTMAIQAYLGIHSEDGNSWTLAQRERGGSIMHKRFRNSLNELAAMAEYIANMFFRPRIYIAAAGTQSLALLRHLGSIPDAEVVFISEVGYRQIQSRWPNGTRAIRRDHTSPAALLAYCAECMV
jgi:hypothetical protein